MIPTLAIIPQEQLIGGLVRVSQGFNLSADLWDTLYDMGLVDTITDNDGFMRDVLTESGKRMLDEGQAAK